MKYEISDKVTPADTWKTSNAERFLWDFLVNNGTEDWASQITQQTIGSSEGGSKMYFIQISMARCFGMFLQMHEAMQDYAIEQLSSGIKGIVSDLGTPKVDSSIVPLLLGVMATASSFAPTLWFVGSPLAFASGLFSSMSALMSANPPELSTNDALEEQLGKVFGPAQKHLEESIKTIFNGKPLFHWDGDYGIKRHIADTFADGKFLDKNIVNKAVESWKKAVTHQITQGLVVNALKHEGYVVFVDASQNEGSCKDASGQWIDSECYTIVKQSDRGTGDPGSRPEETVVHMNGEMMKKLSDSDHDFDMVEFFTNAKNCEGGEPSFGVPNFDENSKLPTCFVNISVMKGITAIEPEYNKEKYDMDTKR
ncbi:hypothetical protein EYZ11_004313 [Aspergillus tanneri]|uniref:Uncharacterized protein n=1 Tax=Aspergillus tanneri TaxID=1220188 RepID=A0A4V3UPS0_9EURO|nr:hypothetical protein EYZ11_004313 [Aspergillus tanneri]